MQESLNQIRESKKLPQSKKVLYTLFIVIAGVVLGCISKMLETISSNSLPFFVEILDLRNFFSRLGIWLFFGVILSVYSKSALRAAINVFLFYASMVASYYLYTVIVAGFFPKSYMMIWVTLTFISPILAFLCWYAKGKGIISIIISSIIFFAMTSQTFVFGIWYLDIPNILELVLWLATIIVLYQSPKQILKVIMVGIIIFILMPINLYWG